jgi:hypothetical protein
MKKQINPTVKAHLIRSAFYVILLLAVCVIPFALAQRNTNQRSVATKPKVAATKAQLATQLAREKSVPSSLVGARQGAPQRPAGAPKSLGHRPTGCQFHVLIVYSDNGLPSQLQSEIQAEPNVVAVDLFDGQVGTPDLTLLQQYEIVVPYSNFPFADPVTLGNNLADYVDGGGVVVQYGFAFEGTTYGIFGRWLTDGYSPYDYSLNLQFADFSLGTFNPAHPLMAGVTTLNSNFQNVVTPNVAATEVAQNNLGQSLVAFRPVSGGHTTVGVTAYIGAESDQSGDWGKVIVNAGNWLRNCGGPCTLSPWSVVANYPLVSESVSVCSDGTLAYAVGGFDAGIGSPTNAFNQYDPVADTWTPLPNIPGAFYDAPSVYDPTTNSVYVFGGLDATFTPSNVLQIYNVGTGTWTTGTPMPGARYFASGAYYPGNGKIYVIAGFDDTFTETSTTWEYDPVADTWDTTRANTPIPLGGSGYSIVDQNIYLAGTWNNAAGSTVHYRYDIVADSWTQMADVPVPIYRPDAAAIGTNTYLVGGGNPSVSPRASAKARKLASTRAPAVSYSSTYIYDTVADSWTTGPNTNVAHSFTGGTAIGTKLIVVTGFDGVTGDTNTVEKSDCGAGGVTPTPTPTPTATATATATPTATATATATPTPTRPPPTPRPRPTPYPRPTPP